MLFIYIALDKLVDGLLHNGPAIVFEKILVNYLRYSIHNHSAVEQSAIAFVKGHAMKSMGENALTFVEGRKLRWASAVVLQKEI